MHAHTAIRGGLVVDGSGAPGVIADVVVSEGRVAAITAPGAVADAADEVDAAGCVVTPGFIDPHTHLDAQLFWDSSGWPSVGHGVTTAVLGNCGFGVAPCPPGGGDDLLRSLEATEEIPVASTRASVPMRWGRWREYFEAVADLPLGINVAGFVPHSALRSAVMGPRASSERADPADVAAQLAELRDALAAGALGLATSRGPNHHDGDGRPVASRAADDDELGALVGECRGAVWQINVAAKGIAGVAGAALVNEEVDRYAALSGAAGARLTWTPLVVAPHDVEGPRHVLAHMRELNQASCAVPQVAPQAMTGSINFEGPSFAGMIEGWQSAWAGFADASPDERRALLTDPGIRAQLRVIPQDCARITSPCYERWTLLASPTRPDATGRSLAELAEDTGTHPVDTLFDLALADDLTTTFQVALSNLDHELVSELVADPVTLIGLGDAGAHVRSITNYCYPTFVLSQLVRDEKRLTLEHAVARMTSHPAAVLGINERGTLRPGGPADLCVIDLEGLGLEAVRLVDDLPGGARRLQRSARGYRRVMVNGTAIVVNDRLTTSRNGGIVRG